MPKEAIVKKGPSTPPPPPGLKVEIIDSPIPEPNDNQVLIKVAVSGLNPKDWKGTERGFEGNQGDDAAGVVAKVGRNVTEFHAGDRVAAFHQMQAPHGTYAEYTIAWQHTTFHIPDQVSFEEAATIPLAALTSAYALYRELRLPSPWTPVSESDGDEPVPLVIYGASTTVGTFAIQLAKRSNLHPIIGIAGASSDIVRPLLDESKGDAVVDYRQGEQAVLDGVRAALAAAAKKLGRTEPLKLSHAYDPASYEGGYVTLAKLLTGSHARLATVAPFHHYKELEDRKEPLLLGRTYVGVAHGDDAAARDLAYVYSRYLGRGLQEGWLRGHPHEVVPGGLNGLGQALQDLKDGKAHGVKYVVRIADTEGLNSS